MRLHADSFLLIYMSGFDTDTELILENNTTFGDSFSIQLWSDLETLSAPLAVTYLNLLLYGCSALSSLSLPLLNHGEMGLPALFLHTLPSLSTFSLPSYNWGYSSGVNFTLNGGLSQATVDGFLAQAVSQTGPGGAGPIYLNGAGASAPSAQGLIDKATLQSRGFTVTTN